MNMENAQTGRWFTSSRSSGNGQCVEVRFVADGVQTRDTKDHGQGPVLTFTRREWQAFVDAAKDGEFDLPT